MFYKLFRKIFFLFDPEFIHHLASYWIKFACGISIKATGQHSILKFSLFGKEISGPVAMAAGFDKSGELVNGLCGYGFGYVETGTFTLEAQPGNPRPRVFRIPEKKALFNRMGFNNNGIHNGIETLKHARFPFAVSIGKSKNTPLENAIDDYKNILLNIEKNENSELKNLILYIAINISSPNTPGLRKLQNKESISELVKTCKKTTSLPIVVKFSPDFEEMTEFETLLKAAVSAGADGVIVTNTSVDPVLLEIVPDSIKSQGGGLSGLPIKEKAEEYLKVAVNICKSKIPVISSGGVMTPEDVWKRLKMGARVVQIYTGFVYNGPGFASECQDYVTLKLTEEGFSDFEDFIKNRKVS